MGDSLDRQNRELQDLSDTTHAHSDAMQCMSDAVNRERGDGSDRGSMYYGSDYHRYSASGSMAYGSDNHRYDDGSYYGSDNHRYDDGSYYGSNDMMYGSNGGSRRGSMRRGLSEKIEALRRK